MLLIVFHHHQIRFGAANAINMIAFRRAYVSTEFHNHATAFLTAGLFECHDRSRFETTAISLGLDANDAMRASALASWGCRLAGIASLGFPTLTVEPFVLVAHVQPGWPYALSTNRISLASFSPMRKAFVLPVCTRAVAMPLIFQQVTDPG